MDCNCNGKHNHDLDTIYLELEDGNKLKCQVVVILKIEDREYIALLPEEGEKVFLYRYEEVEERPNLSIIRDKKEFAKVAEVYNTMRDESERE